MKIVGITGGIGSGKTTVCKVFETLGVPVFYADNEARKITSDHPEVVAAIKARFGDTLFRNGQLNRPALAGIVFNDGSALADLNAMVHPAVNQRFETWLKQHATTDYVLKEAAILIETGGYKQLDKLILVTAPENQRIARILKRDVVNEEEVKARMARQMPENDKKKFADFILKNDGQAMIIPQVLKIHRSIRQNA